MEYVSITKDPGGLIILPTDAARIYVTEGGICAAITLSGPALEDVSEFLISIKNGIIPSPPMQTIEEISAPSLMGKTA